MLSRVLCMANLELASVISGLCQERCFLDVLHSKELLQLLVPGCQE